MIKVSKSRSVTQLCQLIQQTTYLDNAFHTFNQASKTRSVEVVGIYKRDTEHEKL